MPIASTHMASAGPSTVDVHVPARVIMHVDMDAFYVAVALRDRPDLAASGIPVYVGGAQRGVVLSANYAARSWGISGGMSSTQARRLCPQAVVLRPDFDQIDQVSRNVFSIFDTVTPTVEPVSIDEAFLDVTGSEGLFGPPVAVAERIRALIHDEQRITCSVGIGPSKLVAKMASQAAKPDGIRLVKPDAVTSFLHPLPVDALWGVGDVTAERLRRFGLSTIADIAHTPTATLQRAFGPRQGALLADLAWGRDPRPVRARRVERSVGAQETLGRDTDDPELVRAEILRVCDRAAFRLRRQRMLAQTVVLSLRFADFTELTRSVTLRSPVDSTTDVYAAALGLFTKLGLQRARIRRVGVRCEGLVAQENAVQQPTLDEPERGWREAEAAADAIVAKFGPHAVQRARLTIGPDGRRRAGASATALTPTPTQERDR